MIQNTETVHIVFGCSIADTLRKALPLLGSAERVIGLSDSLNIGPINPPDPTLRQAWAKSVLRIGATLRDDFGGTPRNVAQTWAEALSPGIAPVFWVCLSSPSEHACFLAFTARMQDRSFDIVDATDLAFTTMDGVRSPSSLGMLRVQDLVASNLYKTRRLILPMERRTAFDDWSQLQRENAPFRVVRNGRLVSAPLTHFDGLLIDQASQDWEVAARLIGRAMATFFRSASGDSTSDNVLFGRMLALEEAGELEIEGNGPGMRDYRVRRSLA